MKERRSKKKKEKKKKKRTEQPTRKRKGKKKSKVVKNCGWVLFMSLLCMFNYNIAIKLWVMETENSQNVFSVFITHNSKIRELSDRNRVIVYQTTFLSWVPPFLSYELWKLLNQTPPKVPINTTLNLFPYLYLTSSRTHGPDTWYKYQTQWATNNNSCIRPTIYVIWNNISYT